MTRIGTAALLVVIACATPTTGQAQPMTTLEGVVRDSSGGVARVEVIAFDSLRNERRAVVTSERGYYRILGLTPGRYAVSARTIGYSTSIQTIDLATGERAQMDFLLQAAAGILETVTIREQRPNSSIERMSVSGAVTAREIQNLPRNSRNVMELAALAPGIRSFQPASGVSVPGAGALRDERALNLYIDGVEMKNFNSSNVSGSPQAGSVLPSDALEEFRVFLNPYDAEYTRGASYVVSAVSQRGTNEKHGSAFALFQNKDLVSVTDFQRQIANFAKPDFKRRQMGFNFRGPVVRDRLFYAATYEWSNTDTYIAVVPGKPVGDPSFWDAHAGVFKAPTDNHTALLRLTYARNTANTFEAIATSRYLTGVTAFGGIESHQGATSQKYWVNTVNLRHRWLPSPRTANELSLQLVHWSHEHNQLVPGPELRYPTLLIGRANATGEIHEKQFRLAERLTYGIGSGPGSHLIKGGVEVSRVFQEQYVPNFGSGSFRFKSETAEPFEGSIAMGMIHPESFIDADVRLNSWVTGAYVNDEWRVARRLVVNAGFRYDAEINTLNNDFVVPWASDAELVARPELAGLFNRGHRKNDLDNLSPRLSFSWDVTGNRRVYARGGFGIMFDRVPGFVPMNERRAATWRTYTFANPGTSDPAELRKRVLAGDGTAVPTIILLPQQLDAPENRQWSLGFGAQLSQSLALNMDYIQQDIRNLFASVNLNWLDQSTTPAKRVLSSSYGSIVAWGDFARGEYRGLLTSISYTPNASVQLKLSHTLASAKADWDVDNSQAPAAQAGDFYVMQRISGDERHRFLLSGMATLPFGLRLSTITTLASPRPYKATDGRDMNRNNFLEDDFIDGKRYRVPENSWKNWYRVVDLRLAKAIGLGRGANLSLIFEAFNLFNSENYSGYFGVQRGANGELRADFGSPSGTFATRQFQLGSRVEF